MTTKHKVVVIERRFYFFMLRFRAKCKKCGWLSQWRRSETAAMADGWYHDDATLFDMLTTHSPDKPAKP